MSFDRQLGPIKIKLHVPRENFPALAYFCDDQCFSSPDYELTVIEHESELPEIKHAMMSGSTPDFRSRKFQKGQYLLHHRGAPLLKISANSGKSILISGATASTAVWSYFLKYFASHYCLSHPFVHLKASAICDRHNNVSLLIGRSGGGKSVLMHQLMARGFLFLSNTHTLLRQGCAYGMLTAIRVRSGTVFDEHLQTSRAAAHEETGEFLIRPQDIFGNDSIVKSGKVTNIIFADYGGPAYGIHPMEDSICLDLLRNFSLAMNVYGLKEDTLEWLSHDIQAFSYLCQQENSALSQICGNSKSYSVNIDANDGAKMDELANILSR